MSDGAHIGVVGLGVMGANLARNLAGRGYRVAGYDRDPETGTRLARAHPEAGLELARSYAELVSALEKPRRLLVMVPAGAPSTRWSTSSIRCWRTTT